MLRVLLIDDDKKLVPLLERGLRYEGFDVMVRGRFLDLRTLAHALTGEAHTLESACEAFGIRYQERQVKHGIVTPENLIYNGEDVEAT